MTDSGQQDQRIGNVEREAAVRELSFHTNAGRLTADELTERTSAVEAARTRGDLDAIFADLPESGAAQHGPRPMDAPGPSPTPVQAPPPMAPRGLPQDQPAPAGVSSTQPGPVSPASPHPGPSSSIADRLMVGSGTLALIAFVLCGILLNGWGWAWVFFLVPGLLRAFNGSGEGGGRQRDGN